MGHGISFKCPHCGQEINLLFGGGMGVITNFAKNKEKYERILKYGDEELKNKILSGEYNNTVEMMLNELLYKFSEPNPAFASKLKDENGKLLPTVIVYSDYTYEDIFQCSKCHNISRQPFTFIQVDDGLIAFRLDITICEKCHEHLVVLPEIDSIIDFDLYNFFCPKCHKVIKSDDFPEGTYLESIEWD